MPRLSPETVTDRFFVHYEVIILLDYFTGVFSSHILAIIKSEFQLN